MTQPLAVGGCDCFTVHRQSFNSQFIHVAIRLQIGLQAAHRCVGPIPDLRVSHLASSCQVTFVATSSFVRLDWRVEGIATGGIAASIADRSLDRVV